VSSVSCNNPTFDNDILQLQDNEHGSVQSQQLSLVVASCYNRRTVLLATYDICIMSQYVEISEPNLVWRPLRI
jgi:hypothetical protein